MDNDRRDPPWLAYHAWEGVKSGHYDGAFIQCFNKAEAEECARILTEQYAGTPALIEYVLPAPVGAITVGPEISAWANYARPVTRYEAAG
jgi:hypothetical protein